MDSPTPNPIAANTRIGHVHLKVADLELDSLGLIEMLFEIEDQHGFQIPDPMVFLPMTFAEMVAAIDTMVQAHTRSQTTTP